MLNRVDVCSNSSRSRIVSVYLSRTWCLYTWSYLDILITMLNSINCSTVICSPTVILMLLREATSETYGPRVYFPSYQSSVNKLFLFPFIFAFFTLHLYHKNTKNIILSYLSDLTLVSDREGIDNPLIALVARIYLFCVGMRDSRVASYWIDTLVLKNWGKYLRYCAASPFPLQGKTNAVLKR